jgi:hypothetical protein
VADTSVHVDFRHILEGHPGTLQDIQDFSHVAFAQFDQRLFTILRNFDAGINEILWKWKNNWPEADSLFLFNHVIQSRKNLIWIQRSKTEASGTRLQCWNDFAQVVANDAESHVVCVLFDD